MKNQRALSIVLLFGVLLISLLAVIGVGAKAAPAETTAGIYISALRVDLIANDLIYDPERDLLWASSPSSAGAYADSVTPIGRDGAIGQSIPVGSEPNRLAISADGHYLYVGLDGSGAVRRVDLTTGTADLQWSLGTSSLSSSCGPLSVEDMVVLADDPHSVAIARRTTTGCSPYNEGVAVYTDGVMRPEMIGASDQTNVIEPSAAPTTLYGYNNETSEHGFRVMAVNANGITTTTTIQNLLYGSISDMRYADGRIYTTRGEIVNVETMALVDTLPAEGPVVPDPEARRVYFVDYSVDDTNPMIPHFRAFDIDTLDLRLDLEVPSMVLYEPVLEEARVFVGRGEDMFAVINGQSQHGQSQRVYLLTLFEGYEVSGQVTAIEGNGLPAALVTVGSGYGELTDLGGNFSFGVPAGNYTLTATLESYLFDPPARTITVPPDQPGQNFVGRLPVITGKIVDQEGRPMAGVFISNSGGSFQNTYSNVDGTYSFQFLTIGQYRIEPRKTSYTFDPPFRLVDVPPDATEVNFTAIRKPLPRAFLPAIR